ncbi:MAG: hypothetical protein KA168_03390 [Chitinophagales bacterium]|nr:hypothetical protein [Chitinophagales bacterium]
MNEFGEKKTTFAYQKNFLFFASKTFTFATQSRGSKQYELTDHLGNIRTVVPDIKEPLSLPQNQNFRLPTLTLNNYYPYGMLQAGRTKNAGGYRFGFQGQEADNKIGGLGQHTTAQFWEYDTWAIRRWNLDPKPQIGISDYVVFGDNPITNVDPNGDYFFGLFGSTSAQRSAARTAAQQTGGRVMNLHSKNIHVNYTGVGGVEIDNEGNRAVIISGKQEFFDKNGIGSSVTITEKNLAYSDALKQHYEQNNAGWHETNGNIIPNITGTGRLDVDPLDPTQFIAGGLLSISRVSLSAEKAFVYRSLSPENALTLKAGKGIFPKAPNGAWTLEEHLIHGSSKKSYAHDPWIATSTEIDIAKSFSGGNGLVRIDLSKIPPNSIQIGWEILPRSSAGYHYSIWQREVSIFGHIPNNAIKIIKK